jgi:cobalt/nickel transport system ATP-binding protein
MIMDTCQRVILINNGVIIKDGSMKEILYDQNLLEENGLELPFCLQKNIKT